MASPPAGMKARYITFADDAIAINPDHVVYVVPNPCTDPPSTLVYLQGVKHAVIINKTFYDTLNTLEYQEDDDEP
jgi:hypothetical protein